jgi:hypothetical protein
MAVINGTLLTQLQPWFRSYAERFTHYLSDNGLHVRVTSARRGSAKQRKLYRKYLRGESTIPAAPPGHSMHEKGLAFDLEVRPERMLEAAGHAWEQFFGLRWGGRFEDPIHFDGKRPGER